MTLLRKGKAQLGWGTIKAALLWVPQRRNPSLKAPSPSSAPASQPPGSERLQCQCWLPVLRPRIWGLKPEVFAEAQGLVHWPQLSEGASINGPWREKALGKVCNGGGGWWVPSLNPRHQELLYFFGGGGALLAGGVVSMVGSLAREAPRVPTLLWGVGAPGGLSLCMVVAGLVGGSVAGAAGGKVFADRLVLTL